MDQSEAACLARKALTLLVNEQDRLSARAKRELETLKRRAVWCGIEEQAVQRKRA